MMLSTSRTKTNNKNNVHFKLLISSVLGRRVIAYASKIHKQDVGSVVEWLTHRTDDQHGLGSKPTCAILLCSWEKHFTALSPAWWS